MFCDLRYANASDTSATQNRVCSVVSRLFLRLATSSLNVPPGIKSSTCCVCVCVGCVIVMDTFARHDLPIP